MQTGLDKRKIYRRRYIQIKDRCIDVDRFR